MRRASSRIREGPHCLVLNGHLVVLENVYKLVDDTDVNASLNLLLSTRSDIRKHPACLLAHCPLWMIDYFAEALNETAVHHELCLVVVACEYVADGAQAWNDH